FLCDPTRSQPSLLSLHDALPISPARGGDVAHRLRLGRGSAEQRYRKKARAGRAEEVIRELHFHVTSGREAPGFPADQLIVARKIDRKSTRLNSSHVKISYAVFCF